MSDSQYQLLRKIRTLSASVAVLMYLFLQTNRPVEGPEIFTPYQSPYNIADTIQKQTTPPEYNPRGGKVFLARNRKGPSL